MMTVKTEIPQRRINTKTCKKLFNHMFEKKKMTDKKFADPHRRANLPTFAQDAGGLPHGGDYALSQGALPNRSQRKKPSEQV